MTAMLEVALDYAQRGWPVFPLHGIVRGRCTCGRKDCSSPGKHPLPRHGLKDATVNVAVIRKWWTRWPHANVGVATGHPSGIVVVDMDLGHRTNTAFGSPGEEREGQERDVWSSIDQLIHKLPRTLTGLTGGGGLHLIYRGHSRPLRCTCSRLPGIKGELPGIDLRADGGYIVAPPSIHASGQRYEWLLRTRSIKVVDPHDHDERQERNQSPGDPFHVGSLVSEIADAPTWLAEPPRQETPAAPPSAPRYSNGDGTAYGLAALDNALASLRCAPIGQRNHTLNRVAFSMARLVNAGHLAERSTRTTLQSIALMIGLTEREAFLTIESAFRGANR